MFQIFFQPDWQIDNGILNRRLLKSWYTGGGPEQGFWCCFAEGLKSEVLSVAQAIPTEADKGQSQNIYEIRKNVFKIRKNISNRNVFWKSSLKSLSNLKNYYKS